MQSLSGGRARSIPALWKPLGGWRSQLLWRSHGFAVFLFAILKLHTYTLERHLERYPFDLHLYTLAAALLLCFGPRLLLLLLSLFGATALLWRAIAINHDLLKFPDAAYTLYFVLPLFGSLLALRLRDAEELERAFVSVFRIATVTAFGFAALHKLNSDFLNPAVSCIELKEMLTEWWSLPVIGPVEAVGPIMVVILEAATPILLLTLPRLGILAALFLCTNFAMIGPTSFATVLLCASLAFLDDEDGAELLRRLRARWPWLLLAVVLLEPVSHSYYRGIRPWYQFGLVHALCIAIFTIVLVPNGLRGASPDGGSPGSGLAGFLKRGTRTKLSTPFARRCIGVLLALSVFNGLTPYLGLKHEYSYAMLSNLRADDARWNSLVFPKWTRLTAHDPFVHVSSVRLRRARGPSEDAGRTLTRAVFSTFHFKQRVDAMRRDAQRFDVRLSYGGEDLRFDDALENPDFARFCDSLPVSGLFPIKWLTIDGPQPCVH